MSCLDIVINSARFPLIDFFRSKNDILDSKIDADEEEEKLEDFIPNTK